VAIQEAQKKLVALREMLKFLGDGWTVILTDPTEDDLGDDERLAFVFDRERTEVSGLACELVVPLNWNRENESRRIPEQALDRQFARLPYAVSLSEATRFSRSSPCMSTGAARQPSMSRSVPGS
jgi:hypothetical protein